MDSVNTSAFSRSPAWFALRFGGIVLGLLLWVEAGLAAPTASTPSSAPANRYLFLVETSHSMKRRAHGVVESVQNLLGSSLKNQLRPGDTLGVWTYNERLYAGQFPLEQWTPETQPKVAVRLLGFLQDLTYEKKASFDKVVPELERVIRESEYITVILLSSGEEKMKGTPFDDRINAAYKQWQQESQKATGPLVTVLRAKAGKFTDWLVTPASWPPELPPLAPELQTAQQGHGSSNAPARPPQNASRTSAAAALDSALRLAPPGLPRTSNAPPVVAAALNAEPVLNPKLPQISSPLAKPREQVSGEPAPSVTPSSPPAIRDTPAILTVAGPKEIGTARSTNTSLTLASKETRAPVPEPVPAQSPSTSTPPVRPPELRPTALLTPAPLPPPSPPPAVTQTQAQAAIAVRTAPVVQDMPQPLSEQKLLGVPADRIPVVPPEPRPAPPGPEPAPPAAANVPEPRSAKQNPQPLTTSAQSTEPTATLPPSTVAARTPEESLPDGQKPSATWPAPHVSFGSSFHENGSRWALLVLAGVAALFCFRMWIRTFLRPRPAVASAPATTPAGQEPEAAPESEVSDQSH